ncbi:HIR complex subunit [Vermiconidia calcicola]|uniref:HIR complex subunit n=1 Tax=Vermiconidia calcicola TaxID=1690605 RepID=A0ACC3MWI3_9PEZI|nr:HIR complex subunit [Vermiconidia calcicola]
MEVSASFGNNMQMDDGASSSSSISSPPTSPQTRQFADTIHVSRPPYSNQNSGEGVSTLASATSAQTSLAANSAAHNANAQTSKQANDHANGSAPEKPKRQRKKKLGPDGKPLVDDKPKEKKPRKPREPKDKSAPTTSRSKKQKTEIKTEHTIPSYHAPTHLRQPTITEMAAGFPTADSLAAAAPSPIQHRVASLENLVRSSAPPIHNTSNPSTPRPFSSGQNYDPVRGSTMDSMLPRASNPTNGPPPAQAPSHVNRASASPAISSLIDPPTTTKPPSHSPQTIMQQPFVPSQHFVPSPQLASTFAPPPPVPSQHSPPAVKVMPAVTNTDGAMDIGPTCEMPKKQPQQKREVSAPPKSSSSAPTPKAARPTPDPPRGTGSGLLSSSNLFGGPSSSDSSERKGVNIDIQIKLNPAGGNTVNIAQEIVKKYGRDAINPRAAAHREQLLRIAMEQSKFAEGSNDDMSVDLMSEAEGDSNVEMGGMDDEKSNTGQDADGKPARKRRKKVEEYDKEDDFIDDTELAWQEQAAVAKDGFFVYSGPLVPEGQQAQVESSAPTRGSRGGRGRGRGARTATSGTTHASLAEKTRDTTTATRARTRGTRGTGAPRKPRITKADRERMEAEKTDRERAGGTMGGPNGTPNVPALTTQQVPTTATATTTSTQQQHAQPPMSHAHPAGSTA